MLHTHLKVVYLCICIICSVIVIVCYIQNIFDIIISFRRNLTRYAMCAFSGTSVSAMRQFDIGMQNMWSASSCLVVEIKIWIINSVVTHTSTHSCVSTGVSCVCPSGLVCQPSLIFVHFLSLAPAPHGPNSPCCAKPSLPDFQNKTC